MPTATTREANRSYREVLRNRQVAGLLLGDLLANVGTGMIIVAMPVQTLSIHGSVPKAIAIGLVEAAPFVLSTILALAIGLGRVRVPPRSLLIADCVLRSLTFVTLGVLAITARLSLPVLIVGLLFGATFRMAGSSSRRLLATSIAGESGRFAVNGLLGLNATFALYIVGPVLGGVVVASANAGVALFFDAGGALILLVAVLVSVPRAAEDRDALRHPRARDSGWRILRRRPVAARLLVVVFFFNFFYMPIEVALPLYVHETLDADASGLGLMWGALGIGAFVGATLVSHLRNTSQRHVLVAIIGLWAMCPIALAFVDQLTLALIVLVSAAWCGRRSRLWRTASFNRASTRPSNSRSSPSGRPALRWPPAWPDRWRTTNRGGRDDRRTFPVRCANTAAAPACGARRPKARIRVGHTFTLATKPRGQPLVHQGEMIMCLNVNAIRRSRSTPEEVVIPQRLHGLAQLRRVRDRIEREYARPLDVEALARGVHISAGHLSREFRRAYGESPYSYLMTRRIERAMALLLRGDLSVTEVCFEVGCASLGAFSTRFTELVGVPPSVYGRTGYRPIRNREAPLSGPQLV